MRFGFASRRTNVEIAVYLLCGVTALGCALLLLRGYQRTGTRLLLWCGIFFLAMTLENVVLFTDQVIVAHLDLSVVRLAAPLVGVMLLLYGLIWEVK
jgi:hypothetical protein